MIALFIIFGLLLSVRGGGPNRLDRHFHEDKWGLWGWGGGEKDERRRIVRTEEGSLQDRQSETARPKESGKKEREKS